VSAFFDALPLLLKIGAAGQFAVAVLNLCLVRLLHWKKVLEPLPLLLREVFQVHVWFITITLAVFATVTWRFADVIATDTIGRWLAGGISLFWGIRTVIQVCYYSHSHWVGKTRETTIHITLLLAYGGLAVVYGLTAWGGAFVR